MLPAKATRRPLARSRCATRAVVVLLPLLAVMQITGTCGSRARCSPNHSAVPEVKRTPACSASAATPRYGLMPGDFTTH
jgi:hypothetical protein